MFDAISAVLARFIPPARFHQLRLRWWPLIYPLALDYCPVTLPWFAVARQQTPMAKVRRLAMSTRWQQARWGRASRVTQLCVAVALVMWPVQALWRIGAVYFANCRGVSALYGRSRWLQLTDLFRLAFVVNASPYYYYACRLFDPRFGSRAASCLFPQEKIVLYPTLSARRPSDQVLEMKDLFFERSRELGLPVVPCLLKAERGRIVWYGSPETLPPSDLIVKPVDEGMGRRIQRWRYLPADGRWRRGETALDAGQLLSHCAGLASLQRFILQECLLNHRDLQRLSGVALSTARIVTYRRPSGEAGVLAAFQRLSMGDAEVDNISAGGIGAPIDLRTAELGVAIAEDPLRGDFTHHPDSGAPIVGAVVPDFQWGVDIALGAHHAFPWAPFVGWDVAFTPSGPLLVEANPNFGVAALQTFTRTPLGETIYPEVFLEHIEAQDVAWA